MKQFFQKQYISFALSYILFLIVISAVFSYYNEYIIARNEEVKQQAESIMQQTQNLAQITRSIDVSLRGYALMKEDRFLFLSVEEARQTNQRNLATVDSLLRLQGYDDLELYASVKQGLHEYTDLYEQMIGLIRQDSMADFRQLLSEDRGKQFWKNYEQFTTRLYAYEDKLYQASKADYDAAMDRSKYTQIVLVLIGLPTLLFVLRKLRREESNRKMLLANLKENNQKYLFNPGKATKQQEKEILEYSIENLKKAADFINQISEGNYQVEWQELTDENQSLNKDNLVGRLIGMREQMKKVKQEDEKRLWATEGINQFSENIRKHQHSLQELCYESLVFLLKYLHAQQGGLFVHRGEEGNDSYLELAACYAFDRKKFIQKRIEIGQGIVGQTYLEAETVLLTQLPQQYTTITSGLGDATPTCLLIVPMKYNDKVQAIIEIAGFHKYEPHEIAFVEKAGEFVASAIAAAQSTEMTQSLLNQFQQQAEQMRAQEEEMRQNMEELVATQEEMQRKEKEYLALLKGEAAEER
ncbi:GAF domain-containing protein [Rhodocytophaga aerolata]|uniref:GAF domain-containing protein n=1 Tax=Rhodocytophaga aerolata TaxID=455078 RepID=A0ABT8R2B8_9BACT|nr:GAF domain-containing protein [Rhodocytophaga aerolata]MDO1445781.1 GAF domain-containing protein [Rhodocytophaga aerolata]